MPQFPLVEGPYPSVDRSLPLISQCVLLTSVFLYLDTRRTATYLFTQLANLKILIQSLTYNCINQNSLRQSAGTESVGLLTVFIFLFRPQPRSPTSLYQAY